MPELIDGFRIGNYFINFPPGDFINIDENGEMYAEVNVYELTKEGTHRKLDKKEITPELDEMISQELSNMIQEAIKLDNNTDSE